jgi:hypothetical protein
MIEYVEDWWTSGGISWSPDGRNIAVGLAHDIWLIDTTLLTINPLLTTDRVTLQHDAAEARVVIQGE